MYVPRQREDPVSVISVRRGLAAVAIGMLAGAPLTLLGEPALFPVVAWISAAVVALAWVWLVIWPQDAQGTKKIAEQERHLPTTDTAVLVSAVVSLGAVVLAVVRSRAQDNPVATATIVLCVVSATLSWCVVNTVFALKYARLYYIDQDGGIDFKHGLPPAYCDFAYMAFTIGMAFAVSDTEPELTVIRKVALGHALLSYLFSTVILAVAVNLVTNLAQS
jgi:uncharacterized membrane protein